MNETLMMVLVLALGTWVAAAVGAAVVVFFKKENVAFSRIIMGFAAGVILAVTFWELLYPAMHPAGNEPLPIWLIVSGSFSLGFLFILGLDRLIRNAEEKRKQTGQDGFKYRRSVMLGSALSFHNIPEGFALGIVLGALGSNFHTEDLVAVIPMAIAIGIHKMPEGSVLAVSFRKEGMGGLKSFFAGQASGFIGFLLGLVGIVAATSMGVLMPFALSFAGGAMVWVAVHELIPESRGCRDGQNHKKSYLATFGVVLGVLAMLLLHTTFGHHHHHHGHYHDHGGHHHHHNHSHDEHHHNHDEHHHHDHEHHEHGHDNEHNND